MPFAQQWLVLQSTTHPGALKFARTYVPQSESAGAFTSAVDDVLMDARFYVVGTRSSSLPAAVLFGVAHTPGALSPELTGILLARGFRSDDETSGLHSLAFPLSWEVDPRLRAVEEGLRRDVQMAHPACAYRGRQVAQHNAAVLYQAVRDAYGLELNLSLDSLWYLDHIATLHGLDETWRFHAFDGSFAAAAGDFTGEVIRRMFPAARWIEQDRPLELRGATLSPRSKAAKLLCNGREDSLYSFAVQIQQMVAAGRI
jgi:hypothetical protein